MKKVTEWVVFAVIVLGFISDRILGWRLLGLAEAAWGTYVIVTRRASYGIEGRPPAGYITGFLAIVLGLIVVAIGGFMMINPQSFDDFIVGRHK